jgi:HEAT repeat protein
MAEGKGKKSPSPETIARILTKIRTIRDKKIRGKMIMALAGLQQPWVGPVLIEALADPSEEIRAKIISQLAARDNLPCEWLLPKLRNQPWYVKVSVLQILALRKEARALEALRAIINDPNIEVRRQIACCLGQIGSREAIPLLVKLLKDSSPHVRLAAEEALRRTSRLRFT